MKNWLPVLAFFLLTALVAGPVAADPCLIFVHGKQTDTGTYTSYNKARNYWYYDGWFSDTDFLKTATKNWALDHYVVGYNGTRPYYESQSAGEVANEIVNAVNGGNDAGGNNCQGSTSYIVIAHSMGNTIMDFILGNNDPSDPNYNYSGPFDQVASSISYVLSVSGAHRGSEGADAACNDNNFLCDFIAGFIQGCDDATYWLRSDDAVQVRNYASAPARNVYLTGGYEAIFGASACLSGEDDGVVQHASQYACSGSATAGYNNDNVCGNGAKQESSGFFNLDTGHENHDDIRNDSDRDTRRAIPDGIWTCSGSPCSPGSSVASSKSTAQLVKMFY